MTNFWEGGTKDDKLALIYQMNEREKNVKVEKHFGLTKSEEIEKVVMQGETFGHVQVPMDWHDNYKLKMHIV